MKINGSGIGKNILIKTDKSNTKKNIENSQLKRIDQDQVIKNMTTIQMIFIIQEITLDGIKKQSKYLKLKVLMN